MRGNAPENSFKSAVLPFRLFVTEASVKGVQGAIASPLFGRKEGAAGGLLLVSF